MQLKSKTFYLSRCSWQQHSITVPEFIVELESSSAAAYCAIYHNTKYKSAQCIYRLAEHDTMAKEINCQQKWT